MMNRIAKLITAFSLLHVSTIGRESTLCAAEPWSTYRGNLQRTANTDSVPGPSSPKVLWVFKSQEHFIAAPVPHGDQLL
ncbi:MAG TPA: hypothetical protein VG099_22760, partial [Gemmataceae bacterium]|nr:hypothetical protein [Gemmataceae bacterium]